MLGKARNTLPVASSSRPDSNFLETGSIFHHCTEDRSGLERRMVCDDQSRPFRHTTLRMRASLTWILPELPFCGARLARPGVLDVQPLLAQ